MAAFIDLFAQNGITLAESDARTPMGLPKKDHIRALLPVPAVASRWQELKGAVPTETDVERLYAEFIPLQTAAITHHSDVIPGTPQVLALLRSQGIRVGSTTGYASFMMRDLVAAAARGGAISDRRSWSVSPPPSPSS